MAGLYAPLPTLRRRPRGRLRTDRGRRGLLLLHRSGLSPHTPCQSPGALTRVGACTLARSPYFVTRYPKASDISSPPCLLRLLPAGAVAGWGLHPLESAALSRRTPIAAIGESQPRCQRGGEWSLHSRIRRCLRSTSKARPGRQAKSALLASASAAIYDEYVS